MQLKGTLSYFRVKPRSIARNAVLASRLAELLNLNIVFIFWGRLTMEQLRKARDTSKIRPRHVMKAIEWLVIHHPAWRDIELQDIYRLLLETQPAVYEHHELDADSDNPQSNIEFTEAFSVYFADNTMSSVNGGQNTAREFADIVAEAQAKGFQGETVSDLSKEFTRDYLDDNFANSCLLQMPWGRGGLNETRMKLDGTTTCDTDIEEYAEHLCNISVPAFQTALFQLKLFNMKLRKTMLRTANWQLKSTFRASNMRQQLTPSDLDAAQSAIREGRVGGSLLATNLLKCSQAMSKKLPHTDDAAKRARSDMEMMQHHFGLGGFFFTFSPDDENSFLMTAWSQTDKCGEPIDIEDLSNEELRERGKMHSQLRILYPGIAALAFEKMRDIIIRDVIGWDVDNDCPTEEPGLFGVPEAFAGAVEEQGQGTRHMHIIMWIRE